MARIFLPFDRLSAERSAIPGAGLGLPLSLGLVRAMNGDITATSELGIGSTFTVTLPRAAENLPRHGPGDDPGSMAILCVDDDAESRRILNAVLARAEGAEVYCAATASDGIAYLEQDRPDLLVLDRHLPDMAGDELLRHVVRLGPRVPGRPHQLRRKDPRSELCRAADRRHARQTSRPRPIRANGQRDTPARAHAESASIASRVRGLASARRAAITNWGQQVDTSVFGLQGKKSLVVGGGFGIGRASALLLARAGADVVVADLDLARAKAVAEEVTALGRAFDRADRRRHATSASRGHRRASCDVPRLTRGRDQHGRYRRVGRLVHGRRRHVDARSHSQPHPAPLRRVGPPPSA